MRSPPVGSTSMGMRRCGLKRCGRWARRHHQLAHLLQRLDAVHRLLHLGLNVLHAEGHTVETQAAQVLQALVGDGARVDLDRILALGQKIEALAQRLHHARQLCIAQEGGRAAAEVQLRHRLAVAQRRGDQRQLMRHRIDVRIRPPVVAGDDLVAGAVVAHRLAERHMHIHRQRPARPGHHTGRQLRQRLQVLLRPEGLHEPVRRGIGGVARPGHIHAPQQLFVQRRGVVRPLGRGFRSGHRFDRGLLFHCSDCASVR